MGHAYILLHIARKFFFQAEDGIRDPLWSRGLGDVYKRQSLQLWKVKLGLNFLTKMKQWRNFTQDSLLATEKVVGHAYILLHIAGSGERFYICNNKFSHALLF